MENLTELKTISTVDAVTDQLRERLFNGHYGFGQEIKDTAVANDFGVARPTARIAVQRLVAEGILERKPGSSARVRTFEPEQVRDIYRVRIMIELDALREIREKGLPLSKIEGALEKFSSLKNDADDWNLIAKCDVIFHSAVVDAGGSPKLSMYFKEIANEIRLLIANLDGYYSGVDPLVQEHVELLEMLKSDATLAELQAYWEAHLRSASDLLEGSLKTLP